MNCCERQFSECEVRERVRRARRAGRSEAYERTLTAVFFVLVVVLTFTLIHRWN